MAHINPDFKTKKELRDAVREGKRVVLYQPGPFPLGRSPVQYVEGPAALHRWYAKVEAREMDGEMVVVKVVS